MANIITQKLYNGEVELNFYPDSHRYRLAGERSYLISVTSATGMIDKSRVLIPWAVNLAGAHLRQFCEACAGRPITSEELLPIIEEAVIQHQLRKEAAGSIGDFVHNFAEAYAQYKIGAAGFLPPEITDETPQEAINGINAFLDWCEAHKVEFVAAERLIYSKVHNYVGKTDAVAKVDGKTYLIDYKTSKGVYNEHYYQVAAYRAAYEEETGQKLDGIIILHFDKETGHFEAIPVAEEEYKKNIPVFLACLTIKRREKELYQWN